MLIPQDYRADLGEAAVEAHTGLIGNGQETEPFETQALDTLTNILHAAARNWDVGDEPFDADRLMAAAVHHYEAEAADAK